MKRGAEESKADADKKLEETLRKLKELTVNDINEFKNYGAPTDKMKKVMMACCFLLLDNKMAPGFLNKTEDIEYWALGKTLAMPDAKKLFVTLT